MVKSIIAYKGRLSFLQYMPKKPHKWGMNAWVLAEAGRYRIHVKIPPIHQKGHHQSGEGSCGQRTLTSTISTQVVNYAKALLNEGFGCCGTVCLIPDFFKKQVGCTGEVAFYKDGQLLGLKWKEKRIVTLLTTIHNESTVTKTRRMNGH